MIRQKRKMAIKSLYVSIAFISIAFVAFRIRPLMLLFGGAGVVSFGYYLYLSFTYWKCPSCGQQFPVVYSRMDERTECWHCLAPLDGELENPQL